MAFAYKIQQGEDLLVELPVVDELGSVVDVTSATDIIVTFTIKGETVDKFSLNTLEDYNSLTIKTGVGNEHILILGVVRSNSKAYPVGSIQANTLVEVADVDLTNKRSEYNSTDFIEVTTGFTKLENI